MDIDKRSTRLHYFIVDISFVNPIGHFVHFVHWEIFTISINKQSFDDFRNRKWL